MGKRAIKTRAGNTMSESAFWTMIRSAMRQKSRYWKPITQCKHSNRRKYVGENARQKWEYQCNHCKEWWMEKQISVDHIMPVGTLKKAEDLPAFVENLFCEKENLQVLCKECHNEKTKEDRLKSASQ